MKWSDIPRNPSERMLRQFGGLCFLFFGGLALYGALVRGNITGPICLALVAIVTGILGLTKPKWLAGLFVGWMLVTFPIGYVISRVIMLTVFLLVFTPMALIFKLIGRDALSIKKRKGPNTTYWVAKTQPTDPARYLKQY
jgi:Saxitoxin biosynthesis operon protein SxtJ